MLFQAGLFKVHRVDATVIVVGNVIAGGAGKTPTVISIAQHLSARNLRVGVISRGYGRDDRQMRGVDAASSPHQVGDEPLLIFKATHCPVFVGHSRYAAARALLDAHPDTQVLLCDDGLQHYGLHRDLEVLVFDDRGIGNGWLLPAGPLREPWPRGLVHRSGQAESRSIILNTGKHAAFPGFVARRRLAAYAVSQAGERIDLTSLTALAAQRQKPLYAVAGLAQPAAFFDMLRALHLPIAGSLALPDHFDYRKLDLALGQRYTLLCTEKDAAKLWQTVPDALAVPLIQSVDGDFWPALEAGIGLNSG